MTGIEFCEGCPMRGEVQGEIKGRFDLEANLTRRFGHLGLHAVGTEHFYVSVYIDDKLNSSEVIMTPKTQEGKYRVTDRIDACETPIMDHKGIFRKRQIPVGCPAIGDLGLVDPTIKEEVTSAVRRELLDATFPPDNE